MRPPRGLSPGEAALWRKLVATVTPLEGNKLAYETPFSPLPQAGWAGGGPAKPLDPPGPKRPTPKPARLREVILTAHGLDGTWERKLAKAQLAPDFTLDLHGCTLDAAHARLMGGLGQAVAMGARLVLVIAGKPRPHAEHDLRGSRRGAIRAKLLDWLAASPHASRIAAVRPAAQRHGGAGAVYVVLRRAPRA